MWNPSIKSKLHRKIKKIDTINLSLLNNPKPVNISNALKSLSTFYQKELVPEIWSFIASTRKWINHLLWNYLSFFGSSKDVENTKNELIKICHCFKAIIKVLLLKIDDADFMNKFNSQSKILLMPNSWERFVAFLDYLYSTWIIEAE